FDQLESKLIVPVVVSSQVMVAFHQSQHPDQFIAIDGDTLHLHCRKQVVQTDKIETARQMIHDGCHKPGVLLLCIVNGDSLSEMPQLPRIIGVGKLATNEIANVVRLRSDSSQFKSRHNMMNEEREVVGLRGNRGGGL